MDLATAAETAPEILAEDLSPLELLAVLTKAVELSNDARVDFYAAVSNDEARIINERGALADEATRRLAQALILSTHQEF